MKIFSMIFIAIFILLFINCATHRATINTYVDPNFRSGSIRHIAVFPITNTRMLPSESQQINRRISQGLIQRNRNLKIMSSAQAVNLLNQNSLADDWAVFLGNFSTSGIPDRTILQKVGQALRVDAILQGEIVDIYQQDGAYGRNKGSTRVNVRFTLINTRSGKLEWEAASEGLRETATTLEKAPPAIQAIALAVDKIINNLPRI